MRGSWQRVALCLGFLFSFALCAEARQWTDRQGRKMSATYARLDGTTVVMQQGLKVLRIPLRNLSDADQDFIRKQNGGKLPVDDAIAGNAPVDPNPNPIGGQNPVVPPVAPNFPQPVVPNLPQPGFPNIPRPVVPNFPRPGFPNIPQPNIPSIPVMVPHRYPTVGNVVLDEPRWWHLPGKLVFACPQSITWSSVTIGNRNRDMTDVLQFAELSPSEMSYVIGLLEKGGQNAMIGKIRETEARTAGINPNATRAIDPGLPETDMKTSESREWYNGYEPIRGSLREVTENAVRIDDGSTFGAQLNLATMFDEDAGYISRFLEKHKAIELSQKLLQNRDRHGEAFRTETVANGDMRSWNLTGSGPRQGRIAGYSHQGMTLIDNEGKPWRTTFRKISDDDTRYLQSLADSRDDFKGIRGHLRFIGGPSSPPAVPGQPFSPPNFQPVRPPSIPSFPTSTPDFSRPSMPAPVIPDIRPPMMPTSTGPQMTAVCENCKRAVPDSVKAGDHCPHCGIFFEYEENADGSRTYAPGQEVGKWIGIGVFALLVVAGIARRMGNW